LSNCSTIGIYLRPFSMQPINVSKNCMISSSLNWAIILDESFIIGGIKSRQSFKLGMLAYSRQLQPYTIRCPCMTWYIIHSDKYFLVFFVNHFYKIFCSSYFFKMYVSRRSLISTDFVFLLVTSLFVGRIPWMTWTTVHMCSAISVSWCQPTFHILFLYL
jgi:hypothetical protein